MSLGMHVHRWQIHEGHTCRFKLQHLGSRRCHNALVVAGGARSALAADGERDRGDDGQPSNDRQRDDSRVLAVGVALLCGEVARHRGERGLCHVQVGLRRGLLSIWVQNRSTNG
jgi:hypothetical protein